MSDSDIHSTLSKLKTRLSRTEKADSNATESIDQLISKLEDQLLMPEVYDNHTLLVHMRFTIEELEYPPTYDIDSQQRDSENHQNWKIESTFQHSAVNIRRLLEVEHR